MNQRESRFTLHFIRPKSCNIQAAKLYYIIQEVLGSINRKKFTNYKRCTSQQGQVVYSVLMPYPFLMALPHSLFFNILFVADIQFDRNYATEMYLHNNVGYNTFKDSDFKQRQ
jgi:hypothetical protein